MRALFVGSGPIVFAFKAACPFDLGPPGARSSEDSEMFIHALGAFEKPIDSLARLAGALVNFLRYRLFFGRSRKLLTKAITQQPV
jgi:hypothetical protein